MATTARPNPLPPNLNIGPILVGVSYAFIFPTVFTACLRLWVRFREKLLGADDYTIAISTLLSIVLSALSIEGVHHGKGRHVWYLTNADNVKQINKLSWINQIVLFVCICLIKISICLLFLRIKNTKRLRWFLYTLMAGLIITNLECIIVLLIECKPVYAFWDRTKGHCRNPAIRIYSIYVQASYSVLTDLLCSLLPIVIVWDLQLAFKKKVAVCVLMAMGLVATAFAAVRASSLGTNITDTTFEYTYSGTWSVIEVNLGIIAANLAPLRHVFQHFRRQWSTHLSNSRSRQTYGSSNDNTHRPATESAPNGTALHAPPKPNTNNLDNYSNNHGLPKDRRASSLKSDRSEIPLKPMMVEFGEIDLEGQSSNSRASSRDPELGKVDYSGNKFYHAKDYSGNSFYHAR